MGPTFPSISSANCLCNIIHPVVEASLLPSLPLTHRSLKLWLSICLSPCILESPKKKKAIQWLYRNDKPQLPSGGPSAISINMQLLRVPGPCTWATCCPVSRVPSHRGRRPLSSLPTLCYSTQELRSLLVPQARNTAERKPWVQRGINLQILGRSPGISGQDDLPSWHRRHRPIPYRDQWRASALSAW